MCFYCTKTSHSDGLMLSHLRRWHGKKAFTVRIRTLDEKTGVLGYKSKHFRDRSNRPIILNDLVNYHINYVDLQQGQMKKSRRVLQTKSPKKKSTHSQDTPFEEAANLIPEVIKVLEEEERAEDFVAVLRKIHKRELNDNVALQLLLDIGQKLRQQNPKRIRYTDRTKKFWLAFSKLGKGKMRRFMAGGRKNGMH